MQKPFVTFLPSDTRAYFDPNEDLTVLDLAKRAKLPLDHSCDGNGTCTTCRVIVESGVQELPKRNEIELEHAEERHFDETERLSCQLQVYPGLRVRIP